MNKVCVEPKLLKPERITQIYLVYDACSQIFDGSPISELFGHIAALSTLIKERDEQLFDIIKATGE